MSKNLHTLSKRMGASRKSSLIGVANVAGTKGRVTDGLKTTGASSGSKSTHYVETHLPRKTVSVVLKSQGNTSSHSISKSRSITTRRSLRIKERSVDKENQLNHYTSLKSSKNAKPTKKVRGVKKSARPQVRSLKKASDALFSGAKVEEAATIGERIVLSRSKSRKGLLSSSTKKGATISRTSGLRKGNSKFTDANTSKASGDMSTRSFRMTLRGTKRAVAHSSLSRSSKMLASTEQKPEILSYYNEREAEGNCRSFGAQKESPPVVSKISPSENKMRMCRSVGTCNTVTEETPSHNNFIDYFARGSENQLKSACKKRGRPPMRKEGDNKEAAGFKTKAEDRVTLSASKTLRNIPKPVSKRIGRSYRSELSSISDSEGLHIVVNEAAKTRCNEEKPMNACFHKVSGDVVEEELDPLKKDSSHLFLARKVTRRSVTKTTNLSTDGDQLRNLHPDSVSPTVRDVVFDSQEEAVDISLQNLNLEDRKHGSFTCTKDKSVVVDKRNIRVNRNEEALMRKASGEESQSATSFIDQQATLKGISQFTRRSARLQGKSNKDSLLRGEDYSRKRSMFDDPQNKVPDRPRRTLSRKSATTHSLDSNSSETFKLKECVPGHHPRIENTSEPDYLQSDDSNNDATLGCRTSLRLKNKVLKHSHETEESGLPNPLLTRGCASLHSRNGLLLTQLNRSSSAKDSNVQAKESPRRSLRLRPFSAKSARSVDSEATAIKIQDKESLEGTQNYAHAKEQILDQSAANDSVVCDIALEQDSNGLVPSSTNECSKLYLYKRDINELNDHGERKKEENSSAAEVRSSAPSEYSNYATVEPQYSTLRGDTTGMEHPRATTTCESTDKTVTQSANTSLIPPLLPKDGRTTSVDTSGVRSSCSKGNGYSGGPSPFTYVPHFVNSRGNITPYCHYVPNKLFSYGYMPDAALNSQCSYFPLTGPTPYAMGGYCVQQNVPAGLVHSFPTFNGFNQENIFGGTSDINFRRPANSAMYPRDKSAFMMTAQPQVAFPTAYVVKSNSLPVVADNSSASEANPLRRAAYGFIQLNDFPSNAPNSSTSPMAAQKVDPKSANFSPFRDQWAIHTTNVDSSGRSAQNKLKRSQIQEELDLKKYQDVMDLIRKEAPDLDAIIASLVRCRYGKPPISPDIIKQAEHYASRSDSLFSERGNVDDMSCKGFENIVLHPDTSFTQLEGDFPRADSLTTPNIDSQTDNVNSGKSLGEGNTRESFSRYERMTEILNFSATNPFENNGEKLSQVSLPPSAADIDNGKNSELVGIKSLQLNKGSEEKSDSVLSSDGAVKNVEHGELVVTERTEASLVASTNIVYSGENGEEVKLGDSRSHLEHEGSTDCTTSPTLSHDADLREEEHPTEHAEGFTIPTAEKGVKSSKELRERELLQDFLTEADDRKPSEEENRDITDLTEGFSAPPSSETASLLKEGEKTNVEGSEVTKLLLGGSESAEDILVLGKGYTLDSTKNVKSALLDKFFATFEKDAVSFFKDGNIDSNRFIESAVQKRTDRGLHFSEAQYLVNEVVKENMLSLELAMKLIVGLCANFYDRFTILANPLGSTENIMLNINEKVASRIKLVENVPDHLLNKFMNFAKSCFFEIASAHILVKMPEADIRDFANCFYGKPEENNYGDSVQDYARLLGVPKSINSLKNNLRDREKLPFELKEEVRGTKPNKGRKENDVGSKNSSTCEKRKKCSAAKKTKGKALKRGKEISDYDGIR